MNNLELKNIFPLYLGCEVMYVGADRVLTKKGDIRRFNIVDLNRMWNDLSDYKLVLRNIKDMTDDEKKVAANLSGVVSFATGNIRENENLIFKEAQHTLYLLKRGFDLFGLIDKGLAVDKKESANLILTTLKK